jgi:hypothetical protein
MLLDPQFSFGDAYTAGRVTVEGSLVAMLETVFRSTSVIESHNLYSKISPFLTFLQRNSLRGTRKNIHRHYAPQDLPGLLQCRTGALSKAQNTSSGSERA